jgi:hypothetical protein
LNSPTACTSAAGNWSNPGNATASDNQYSTANSNNRVLVCTFNLPAIPSGGTINGIEVSIEGSSSGAREAVVELSWDGGTTYTSSNLTTTFGATETTFALGGAANTWGRTWEVGDFTSANFRARLTTNNGSGTISLDHVQVKVYYTADTTPPQTTIDSTTPSTSPTNSTTMSIAFSSNEAGSTFQCRLDGGAYASCTSPANLAGLSDGSHTFEVFATDSSSNADPTPASYTWTVDTTAPDTTITATPSNPSNDSTPTFSFTSADATATFQCRMDGGAYSACISPATFGPLADGPHTFDVRALDPLGNTDATPASFAWTIDTTAPDTNITSNPSDPSNDSTPTFSFSSADATATFQCQVDGGGYSACTSGSSFGPLGDGSHTFNVRAVDPAGNQDPTPASHTWTVDGAAPTVPSTRLPVRLTLPIPPRSTLRSCSRSRSAALPQAM